MKRPALLRFAAVSTTVTVLAAGCASQVAPSKTASGAGTGAVIGGTTAAVAGAVAPSSGLGSAGGVLGGLAAGAIIGGTIGAIQEAQDRKEQDRLAQERAYQMDVSRQRSEDAKAKLQLEEELAVRKGFQISDLELQEAQKDADDAQARLDTLQKERQAAYDRTKKLEDLKEKTLSANAEADQLEQEIARLKSNEPIVAPSDTEPVVTATATQPTATTAK